MNRRGFLSLLLAAPLLGPTLRAIIDAPVVIEAAPIAEATFNLKAVVTPIPFLSMEEFIHCDPSAVKLLSARMRDAGDSWTRAEYL